MSMTHTGKSCACDLHAPKRNHYFYGKLLDVYHFELETSYHRYKRRLGNRLVTGPGVVCGLDVRPCRDGSDAVVVTPGFAIDRFGNEVIVPEESRPVEVPAGLVEPARDDPSCAPGEEEGVVHLVICYHECSAEPMPVLTGECGERDACQPGVILERYRLEMRPGHAPPPPCDICIPDCIAGGKLDYPALAKLVTEECLPCPEDPCIPLAEIRTRPRHDKGGCPPEKIDVTVRPIVLTNDLLFQLILCGVTETRYRRQK